MNARPASLALAAALALLLSACNRPADEPPGGGRSAASAASSAGGAASSASAPASASAAAAGPLVPASSPSLTVPPDTDTGAGRQIAAQGAPGAAACASCHGASGEGNPGSGFPRLAALGSVYILHQLNSYADGTRAHPVMTPIASALNPQQRAEVAAYYATLGAATPQAAGTPASAAVRPNTAAAAGASNASAGGGGTAGHTAAAAGSAGAMGAAGAGGNPVRPPVIAVRGDEARGIQACVNCHGPQGIGDAGPNPYLAGQNAQYLSNAMAAWKSGARHNDPSGQMPAIAKALDDGQVQQLVAYFSALPPPEPRNAQAAAARPAGTRAAVQSGPVSATAAAQGTGTDQGASTSGGSQSQGVGGAAQNPGQGPNR